MRKNIYCTIIFLFLLIDFSFAQNRINYTFRGKITDQETKRAVPFATIIILNSTLGAVSDLQGTFNLNVPNEYLNHEIEVSSIGYEKITIELNKLSTDRVNHIILPVQNFELNEIIVRDERISTEEILIKTIREIKKNYFQKSMSYEIYTKRELRDYENDSPILIQEIVANSFSGKGYSKRRNAHSKSELYYSIFEQKSEAIGEIIEKYNNYDYGLFFGYGLIILDAVRHKNNLLNEKNLVDFSFKINEVEINDLDTVYCISFKCHKSDYKNTAIMAAKEYLGKVYISLPDYAVIKYEGDILLNKDKRFTSQRNFDEDPKLSFTSIYKKENGYYFLNYAKSSMIIFDQTNKLRFDQIFIPYNYNINKPVNISESSDNSKINANSEFWKNYDIPLRATY